MTDDQTPDEATTPPEPPQDTTPVGDATYYYEVTDDDGKVLTAFTAMPEKVSDVSAVRLVRGQPLDDAVSVRQNGKPLAAFDVDRQHSDLHLDRYEMDEDGNAVGDPVSHPIRLV
jgi:hypothetical protein